MDDIFVDTAGWGCLVDRAQTFHALTAEIYRAVRERGRRVVTTNYVITELAALMISPLRIPRSSIVSFITGLKTSPSVEIVHIDPDLDAAAWKLFAERPDKEWSLVDCASIVVMQARGITEALTTDHHFEQAGFVRLLK